MILRPAFIGIIAIKYIFRHPRAALNSLTRTKAKTTLCFSPHFRGFLASQLDLDSNFNTINVKATPREPTPAGAAPRTGQEKKVHQNKSHPRSLDKVLNKQHMCGHAPPGKHVCPKIGSIVSYFFLAGLRKALNTPPPCLRPFMELSDEAFRARMAAVSSATRVSASRVSCASS